MKNFTLESTIIVVPFAIAISLEGALACQIEQSPRDIKIMFEERIQREAVEKAERVKKMNETRERKAEAEEKRTEKYKHQMTPERFIKIPKKIILMDSTSKNIETTSINVRMKIARWNEIEKISGISGDKNPVLKINDKISTPKITTQSQERIKTAYKGPTTKQRGKLWLRDEWEEESIRLNNPEDAVNLLNKILEENTLEIELKSETISLRTLRKKISKRKAEKNLEDYFGTLNKNRLCDTDRKNLKKWEKRRKKEREQDKISLKSFFIEPAEKSISENLIDDAYYFFIANTDAFKEEIIRWEKMGIQRITSSNSQDTGSMFLEIEKAGLTLKEGAFMRLPAGHYSTIDDGVFIEPGNNYKTCRYPDQGWKLHVTATPHSAATIGKIILNTLMKFDAHYFQNSPQKCKKTHFKIIFDIPHMRTMFYVLGNVVGDGRETQVGKFITIYPINTDHAVKIAKTLDEALLDEMNKIRHRSPLKKEAFIPSFGEAQVGESGGVYTRYGCLSGPKTTLKKLKYNKRTRQYNFMDDFVQDDRYHPWPDFMNTNEFSIDAPNPFDNLALKWTDPITKKEITWEKRPKAWENLESSFI